MSQTNTKVNFDGQKFTVSGLYFNDSSTDHVGLFGYIYSSTIKNVGVTNSYFCGKDYVGGVCGRTAGTYNAKSYVINCYNAGTVSGSSNVGGVCGQIFYCYEANCYNTGTVTGGTVTGTQNVGGVCGYIWYSSVINCYNTGTVTGTNYVGGGYGYSFGGSFENSYYLAESANDNGGKTAEQFHSGEITFLLSKGESVTADETYPASVWGQDLSTPDSLPVLNGKTVYKYCDNGTVRYSNEQLEDVHDYVSHGGICPCGEGSPAEKDETDGYYKIENRGNLYWFAGLVNGTLNGTKQDQSANAKLMTDIVVNDGKVAECNGTKGDGWFDWTPIGKDKTNSYQGTFDGQGHTISGLYFNDSKTQYVGLFGYITSSGYNISNVGVVNSYFYGYDDVGGVCGHMNGGGISNCYNASTVKSKGEAGGICGVDDKSEAFKKCYNTGNITSNGSSFYYVGGICGANTSYADSFINCYNTGTVNSSDKTVAGAICGYNGAYGSKILYCYNTGSVNGKYDTAYGKKGTNASSECICYYLAEADDGNGGKTEAQFKNGEVAYLLQGSQTEEVWGQNIDKAEPYDSMPVYGGEKVYKVCNKGTSGYSNTSGNNDHLYGEDGYCACGELEPANIDSTDGYYIIKNKGNLFWFAGLVNGTLVGIDKNVSANAKLENDITVNSNLIDSLSEDGTVKDGVTVTNWMPIGKDSNYYTGTFKGQNFTISGLYFNDSDTDYIGLFGLAGDGANVSNITIEDSYLNGDYGVGGVCGYNNGTIKDCKYTGYVGGNRAVGGVCGHMNGGGISNCYNASTVKSKGEAGGICGYNRWGTLTNCYNTGAVTSENSDYVGGVCGYNYKEGTIRNCYNTYTVTGRRYVGGVCGYNEESCSIVNCYNIGDVTGTDTSDDPYKGSICGFNETKDTIITNCYYLGTEETDSLEGTEYVTEERFHSGEIAFLLKYTQDDFAWGQDLSNSESYPELNSEQYPVYKICSNGDFVYSNDNSAQSHWIKDGFCTVCGAYVPAVLTTDKYDIDGDGDYDEVYEISNVGQLYWFAGLVNGTLKDGTPQNTAANAVLMNNITVNKDVLNENGELNSSSFKDWTPIGDSTYKYTGNFNGSNYTISGLYFVDTQTSYVGLFGYISGEDAKVYNLGILDSYFSGHYVGGVCGYNYCGTITNCYNKGAVASTGKGAYVGGVCGYYDSDPYSKIVSTFENCYNTGKVTSTGESSNVGGVCGYNYCGTITGCHNTGAVSGRGNVGGVCGYNACNGYFEIGGTLKNCYNTGTVTSTGGNVGGVCGYNNYYSTITKCYNESTVSGRGNVGGVCGYNYNTIQDCHSTGSVTSSHTAGGVCGVCGDADPSPTIKNCYNTGSVTGGYTAGGVCGYNDNLSGSNSTIANCHSTGNVTLKNTDSSNTDVYGGGVCGLNYKGTIANCYIIGDVTVTDTGSATNLYDGGVCGKNDEGTIANCYIMGDVTVTNTGSITNSYDGDLCGSNETGTIANCYYLADKETDEIDGTTFKTTSQFNSGEVAYLISQGCTIGEGESAVTYDGSVWGQTLEGEDIQDSPVLGGKKVYINTRYNCEFDFTYYYANTLDSNSPIDHKDDDSNCYCDYCGNIMSVNLTLTVPKDGEAMPSAFASLSNGISVSDFAIDSDDTTADYKKTYTVSANVNVSAEGKIILNTTAFSINGTAVTATKNEDDSYAVSFEFKPTVDLSVTANMENGAAIRLTNVNGLRFCTQVDADKIARLKELGATVEIGTLIAPKDLLDGKDLTFESSKYVDVKYQATDENGAYDWHKDTYGQIAGSIVNIKENTESNPDSGNIARDFVGRGYVKVTLGGETVITYADYAKGENDISSVENNTRSLAYVADALKNDTEKYNTLDDDTKILVEGWASKLANEQ